MALPLVFGAENRARSVTPVKTGVQFFVTSRNYWIPAFAGMTENIFDFRIGSVIRIFPVLWFARICANNIWVCIV